MLTMHLEPPYPGPALVLGPAPYFRLKRGTLLAGPLDQPVATLQDGHWVVGLRRYVALLFPIKVLVRFQRHGRECQPTRGPLLGVRIEAATVRHGEVEPICLARMAGHAHRWLLYPYLRPCDSLIFEPAECDDALVSVPLEEDPREPARTAG
jgi:hypothetical protein